MGGLADGWRAALDTSRKPFQVYYFHAVTGETSWDPPPAPEVAEIPVFQVEPTGDRKATVEIDQARLFLEVLQQQFSSSLPVLATAAGFEAPLRILWNEHCAIPHWDDARRAREFEAFTSSLHNNAESIRKMCGLPALDGYTRKRPAENVVESRLAVTMRRHGIHGPPGYPSFSRWLKVNREMDEEFEALYAERVPDDYVKNKHKDYQNFKSLVHKIAQLFPPLTAVSSGSKLETVMSKYGIFGPPGFLSFSKWLKENRDADDEFVELCDRHVPTKAKDRKRHLLRSAIHKAAAVFAPEARKRPTTERDVIDGIEFIASA